MKQAVLIRSGQRFKQLERAAKAATHAALELANASDVDAVGRYTLTSDESVDSAGLLAFLQSAEEQCQGMCLTVIVIAKEANTGGSNGTD